MLRYDALLTFYQLNYIESRLLESEFVNWLLDVRSQCLVDLKIGSGGSGGGNKKNSIKKRKMVMDKDREVNVVGGILSCYEIDEQLGYHFG